MLRCSGVVIADVVAVKQDAAFRRVKQAGDEIEQGGLAATRRTKQRIGAAIGPIEMHALQGKILVARWVPACRNGADCRW